MDETRDHRSGEPRRDGDANSRDALVRVGRLEARVEHIEADVTQTKGDVKALAAEHRALAGVVAAGDEKRETILAISQTNSSDIQILRSDLGWIKSIAKYGVWALGLVAVGTIGTFITLLVTRVFRG